MQSLSPGSDHRSRRKKTPEIRQNPNRLEAEVCIDEWRNPRPNCHAETAIDLAAGCACRGHRTPTPAPLLYLHVEELHLVDRVAVRRARWEGVLTFGRGRSCRPGPRGRSGLAPGRRNHERGTYSVLRFMVRFALFNGTSRRTDAQMKKKRAPPYATEIKKKGTADGWKDGKKAHNFTQL